MRTYERKHEWMEVRLPLDDKQELDVSHYAAHILHLSDKEIAKLLSSGGLELKGGRLRVRLFPSETASFVAEWADLNVLYEDDFCMVVSKPAGMAVHPTEPGGRGTLANAVASYYEATGQQVLVRHIHRLDIDTTGPVLYAKNAYAQIRLDEAMRVKAIHRTYVAVVKGRVAVEQGTLSQPIGKDRHHPARRRVSPGGELAVTHFEVIHRYAQATLLRVRLETGRTHQIRVHMSYMGHPLLGDSLYGGPVDQLDRQALHGESLQFPHPFSREMIEAACPLPVDFQSLLENLK